MADSPIYRHLAQLEWEQLEDSRPEVRDIATRGMAQGARRSRLARGEFGFHSALNELPAGFEVPPHSHSQDEFLVILAGGCSVVDGPTLEAGDSAAIPAGSAYGFTVGDAGMRFVVVRRDDARTAFA